MIRKPVDQRILFQCIRLDELKAELALAKRPSDTAAAMSTFLTEKVSADYIKANSRLSGVQRSIASGEMTEGLRECLIWRQATVLDHLPGKMFKRVAIRYVAKQQRIGAVQSQIDAAPKSPIPTNTSEAVEFVYGELDREENIARIEKLISQHRAHMRKSLPKPHEHRERWAQEINRALGNREGDAKVIAHALIDNVYSLRRATGWSDEKDVLPPERLSDNQQAWADSLRDEIAAQTRDLNQMLGPETIVLPTSPSIDIPFG